MLSLSFFCFGSGLLIMPRYLPTFCFLFDTSNTININISLQPKVIYGKSSLLGAIYNAAWSSGQPNVNTTSLINLSLPLPPLAE